MIIALEVIETFSLVGRNDVTDVLLGMDITDTGGWNVLQDLVADGMNQVGFSKADAAEQVKRILGNARIVGYLNGRSPGKLVGFPCHKTVESHFGIDSALFADRCFHSRNLVIDFDRTVFG